MIAQSFLGLCIFALHEKGSFYLLFPLIGLYIGSLGFIFSNAVSIVLEFFPTMSASANAIIGVLQYSVGALMGFIASSLHDGTLFPITGIMMLVALLGTLILFIASRGFTPHHGKH